MDLNGTVIGRAFLGTMCDERLSVGIAEDGGTRPLATVITLVSHEIGHNFNMRHDDGMYTNRRDWYTYCIL